MAFEHFNESIQTRMQDQFFRAEVGDRSYEIEFRDGKVFVDGEAAEVSFERVAEGYYSLLLDGRSVSVVVEASSGDSVRLHLGGRSTEVRVKDERALLLERYGIADADAAAEREVRAPMPGLVLAVLVEEGQAVKAGDGLVLLEAMKMENELRATGDGVVQRVHVEPGDAVGKSALLIEFE